MKRLIFLVVILTMTTISGFSQLDGNPENWCRNGAFPRENIDYSLGTIKAKKGERVHFYGDDENCPNAGNCRQKSYLIAGNQVIVSRKFGNWVCGWYQPKKGTPTVGWIFSKNLEFVASLQSIERFAGNWKFYDNDIEIKKTKDPVGFEVKGTAFWKGVGDNIHVGEIDGKAKWNEKVLLYGEDDKSEYACKVRLSLVGEYLIVADNLNCGGMNVTFSGVYTRTLSR